MFGTIRKHSKALWLVIATVTILSFIYWGGNRNDQGGRRGPANYGSIAGKAVTEDAYLAAQREVYLNYFLNSGEWPDADAKRTGFDAMRETYFRLFLIQKQEEMGIHVSQDVVAQNASQIIRNFAREGVDGLTVFKKTVLEPRRMTLADLERFIRHNLGNQQLAGAVGLSGKLITPQEIRAIYERENREVSAQVALFSASNYLSQVSVTPAALAEFHSNQLARYRLPERVQVSYVKFEMTNHWAEAAAEIAKMTNLNALIDSEYQRRGTNFYADTTPEKAKASIKEELHQEIAMRAARKQAAEFADKLLAMEPVKLDNLATLAAQQGVKVGVTSPFDRSTPPAELNVNEGFVRSAFSLRADDPFIGPVLGADAFYVIAQNRQLPSENPPFAAVQAKVEQDYRTARAVQLARMTAAQFAQNVTNGLAGGKPFTTLAAEAGTKAVLLPAFSLSTRNLPEVEGSISLQQFKQVAFSTSIGRTSPMVPTMEGALVVYVQNALPLDEKVVTQSLPEFSKLVFQARQSEAFQEWFSREAQIALADTPINRPRQAEMGEQPAAN
jgi:hypothetical protein